ncbi:serine hydrolase domain-containing protein [Lysobacter claricitrinus]|uniref:serine hydrolase domain-containing protein n=1 Tax=Lysobacter claricitrinus TaxID=3367728 RepID=UPI0037DA83DC
MSFRALRFVQLVLVLVAAAWFVWWRPVEPRTGPTPVALDDGWALSTPAAEGFDGTALTTAIERVLDGPYNVHSVLVERHGRIVAEYYQGGRDRSVYALVSIRRSFGPSTLHDVRSIGKSVTSLLYGIALADGKVPPPDAYLSTVYPQLQDVAAENASRVRVRDLLDMSSGLDWTEGAPGINDELRLFSRRDLPLYVLKRPMATAPGTAFNYNGGGTALLADMIASGTGDDIERYAARRLFVPLGIRHWDWVKDLHGRPMAFNGLRLRPRDLLKIGRLAQDHGRWHGAQIVPAAWMDDSWSRGRTTGVSDFTYRAQWWAGTADWHGRRLAWHAGFGNGGQRVFVVPELDIVMVTTAGAYDEDQTAIAVNRLVRAVVASVPEAASKRADRQRR